MTLIDEEEKREEVVYRLPIPRKRHQPLQDWARECCSIEITDEEQALYDIPNSVKLFQPDPHSLMLATISQLYYACTHMGARLLFCSHDEMWVQMAFDMVFKAVRNNVRLAHYPEHVQFKPSPMLYLLNGSVLHFRELGTLPTTALQGYEFDFIVFFTNEYVLRDTYQLLLSLLRNGGVLPLNYWVFGKAPGDSDPNRATHIFSSSLSR